VEINESQLPVAKDRGVPGEETLEQEKVRFKTGANSASLNANLREGSSTPKREIKRETMLKKNRMKQHCTLGLRG